MEQQSTESKKRRRPLVIIGVAAVVVVGLCLCLALFGALAPDENTETTEAPVVAEPTQEVVEATISLAPTDTATLQPPTATPTTRPTNTPRPTARPRPTNTPRPTATPRIPAAVPGLWPRDVTGNMEDRGFACTDVREGELYYVWSCTRSLEAVMLQVDVYGRSLTSVDLIEATILQFNTPDDSLSAEFLGFVSTMPYDGADPEAARAWVTNTLPTLQGAGDVRTATFGGVEYQLYGIPTARTLEIGTLQ